jgi:UPF0755 protein
MKLKYVVIILALLLVAGLSVIFGRTSPSRAALDDFMQNTDTSTLTILNTLYKRNIVRNVVAFNTVIAIERGKALLLKGMGMEENPQNLANPFVRYIKVPPGLRNEEVVKRVSKALNWDEEEKNLFLQEIDDHAGKLFPETYLVPDNIDAEELRQRMLKRFDQEAAAKTSKLVKSKTQSLDNVVKIASLIQREAAGPHDMRLISGIIANRLKKNMSLDIDATLQYAKGNEEIGWWPIVVPADKYIDSPYNTYKNKGLPPTPISNPGFAAISAAANPQKTSCIFYFHDAKRNIHCSVTYKEHVAKIKKYL